MDEFCEMHPEDVRITPRKHAAGDQYLDRIFDECLDDNGYLCTRPFAMLRVASEAEAMLELSHAGEMFTYSSGWPYRTLDPPTWFYTSRAFDDDSREDILHGNALDVLEI